MSDQLESLDRDESGQARDLLLEARKLINVDSEFNPEAFECLKRAVELDPKLIDAWVDLASCHQRKLDVVGAIACLESALEHCEPDKPSKVVLRKLSTCIRQRPCDSQEEKISTLLRSLELSKEALKIDLEDHENHYNLAKAYMCLFFVTECVDQRLINLSRSSFAKALELSIQNSKLASESRSSRETKVDLRDLETNFSCTNEQEMKPFMQQADFLFNYSTVLLYLQDFQKALSLIETSVALEPNWEEPRLLGESIVAYLRQTHLMVNELSRHPKRVAKRFSKAVETLKDTTKIEKLIEMDQKRLCKMFDVHVNTQTIADLRHNSTIEESCNNLTTESLNITGKLIKIMHLKLLEIISYNQAMYLTFIAIDKDYSLIVVTIYNMAASKCPSQRDVLTVVEPKIERIHVENFKDSTGKFHDVSFDRINIREFRELYVNGLRISIDQVSKPQFRVSLIP